jgi:hypothetical protein
MMFNVRPDGVVERQVGPPHSTTGAEPWWLTRGPMEGTDEATELAALKWSGPVVEMERARLIAQLAPSVAERWTPDVRATLETYLVGRAAAIELGYPEPADTEALSRQIGTYVDLLGAASDTEGQVAQAMAEFGAAVDRDDMAAMLAAFRAWVAAVELRNSDGARLQGVRAFLLLRADDFHRMPAPKFLEAWQDRLPGGQSFNYGVSMT